MCLIKFLSCQFNCLISINLQTFATFGTLVFVVLASEDAMAPLICRTKRKYREKVSFYFSFAFNVVQLKFIRHIGNVLVPRPSESDIEGVWEGRVIRGENTSNMAGPGFIRCTIRCLCPPISRNSRVKFWRITSAFIRRQHTKPVEDDRVKNVSRVKRVNSPAPAAVARSFGRFSLLRFCNLAIFRKHLGNKFL